MMLQCSSFYKKYASMIVLVPFLLISFLPAYSSDREKKKIQLKINDNVFDIERGVLPYIEEMVAELREYAPIGISLDQSLLPAGVSPESAVRLNNISGQLTEEYLSTFKHLLNQGKIFFPNNIKNRLDSLFERKTFADYVSTATAASSLLNTDLANVVLVGLASRMVAGQSLPEKQSGNGGAKIENPDLDKTFATILVDMAFAHGTEFSITKMPFSINDAYTVKVQSASLASTSSTENCAIIYQQPNQQTKEVRLFEYQSFFTSGSWYYTTSHLNDYAQICVGDMSKDFKNGVFLIQYPANKELTILESNRNIMPHPLRNDIVFQDPCVVFSKNNPLTYYVRYNASTIVENQLGRPFNNNARVDLQSIQDLWVRKYLETGKIPSQCPGFIVEPVDTFTLRAMHAITENNNFLTLLKQKYGISLSEEVSIAEHVCIKKDSNYIHWLLPKFSAQNEYGVTRVELKPNPRIIPLLKHMNDLVKNENNRGKLYASALCLYHLYVNNWDISEGQLKKKMGAAFELVDGEIKASIKSSAPAYAGQVRATMSKVVFPLIRRSLGMLETPTMMTLAALGGLGYAMRKPFFGAANLSVLFAYISQKHAWRQRPHTQADDLYYQALVAFPALFVGGFFLHYSIKH